ncbi:MAG: putative peroxiredoxin bcp [bacterium ADurb.BinA186]|nr:MAG: putative peroxiredoxin bcp [bacterium ADurb.BinA186]
MLVTGNKAPNFSLRGDDGQLYSLASFRHKPLVIFFYPKDLTPGCTTEACDFSEHFDEFLKHSVNVIGISKDPLASHLRFKSVHNLKMLLLSDPDLAVHQQYGAFGQKILYGKSSLGVIRSTFLIDENGIVQKTWYKVRVKNHVNSVLEAVLKRG